MMELLHSYLSHLSIYLSASPTGVLFREMRIAARTTSPLPVHLIRSPPLKSFLSRHTLLEKLAMWRFHIFSCARTFHKLRPPGEDVPRIRHFYAVAYIVYPGPCLN